MVMGFYRWWATSCSLYKAIGHRWEIRLKYYRCLPLAISALLLYVANVAASSELSEQEWHKKFDDCYKTACNSESDCEGFSCLWNTEKQFLAPTVKRQNSDLIITLENKETTVISNPCKTRWELEGSQCGDGVMYYLYAGYFPSIHQHLIYSVEYESTSFFLVDAHTGEVTSIYGWPVFSLDKKSFISTSLYLEGPVALPNGFEIWEISEGNFGNITKVFNKSFDRTGFGEAEWATSDTIELAQYCINPDTADAEVLPKPAILTRQDTGVWVLKKEYCRCKDRGDE